MKIEKFEDIEAWKMGRDLTRQVYPISAQGRFAKDWSLKDQMIRAASSILHNVAEGFDGGSNAEFLRFLAYASRSCTEVQSQLYVALDQGYVSESVFSELYVLAGSNRGKIGAFMKYLRRPAR